MAAIRDLRESDVTAVQEIYRQAFAGFPWYEALSSADVQGRWDFCATKYGFRAIVAVEDGVVVGALLWDTPTIEDLRLERGDALACFAIDRLCEDVLLVWEREVMVAPSAQGRGIATQLRLQFLECIGEMRAALILTRMRDDNVPIVHIAAKRGFSRTGIKVPSSQKPEVSHEYWYLLQEKKGVS